jgi:Protein of unknown function (DUF3892)
MSEYQVTCVIKEPYTDNHGHIVSIGIRVGTEQKTLTTHEARLLLGVGHRLYTVSPSTGATAEVEGYRCHGVNTLRSTADAVRDNNLDNLDSCPV